MKKFKLLGLVLLTHLFSITSLSQTEFNVETFICNMSNLVSQPKRKSISYIQSLGFIESRKGNYFLITNKNEFSFIILEKDFIIIKTQEDIVEPLLEYMIENFSFEIEDITEDGCQYYLYRYNIKEINYEMEILNCDDYDFILIKEI